MKRCGDLCVSENDPAYGCGKYSCNVACDATGGALSSSFKCVAGKCAIDKCAPGYADCDGDPKNGCEADLGSKSTCGACNVACAGNDVCDGASCKPACTFPKTDCSGACKDLSTDPTACGGCNGSCFKRNAASTCSAGTCTQGACLPNFTNCNGDCVDTSSNPQRCGASCQVCPSAYGEAPTCVAGVCGTACAPGFSKCGGQCVAIASSATDCGGCGKPCGNGSVCASGQCVAAATIAVLTGIAPEDIAVDSTHVYWTEPTTNSVWQADKATWTKLQLGANQAAPTRIAVDSTHVYWTSKLGGAILRAPIGGGTPPVVVASAQAPSAIVLDPSYVFFAASNGIFRVNRSSTPGAPVNLTTDLADELAQVGPNVYRGRFGGALASFITSVDKVSGTVTPVFANTKGMQGLAANDVGIHTSVILSLGQHYLSFKDLSQGDGDHVSRPLSTYPKALVADGCTTFFADEDSSPALWKVESFGLTPYPITTAGVKPHRLAVDDKYVYWTDVNFIGRVPK